MNVRIIPYHSDFAEDFAQLNYSWIEEYFVVEDADRKMLDDPQGYVIDKGGWIYLAQADNGSIVGTVALIPRDESVELTKLAVNPSTHGQGIGRLLTQTAIDSCFAKGYKRVFLETNAKLKPALALYEKLGFQHFNPAVKSVYDRCGVYMELLAP